MSTASASGDHTNDGRCLVVKVRQFESPPPRTNRGNKDGMRDYTELNKGGGTEERVKQPKNPKGKYGFVGDMFFAWIFPMLSKGWKQGRFEFADVYETLDDDKADALGDHLERAMAKVRKTSGVKPENVLLKALLRTFGLELLKPALMMTAAICVAKVMQRLLIGQFVNFFSSRGESMSSQEALYVGLLIAVLASSCSPVKGVSVLGMLWACMRMRVAVVTLTYRKVLRLKSSVLQAKNVGQLMNILSNDASRLEKMNEVHFIWVGLAQFVLILGLTTYMFGIEAVAGSVLLLLSIPFQIILGKLSASIRQKTATLTDKRISIISEMIGGMKVIKMYAWESPFWDRLEKTRRDEMHEIQKVLAIRGVNWVMYEMSTHFVTLLLLFQLVVRREILDVGKLFAAYGLYNNMRTICWYLMPSAILQLSEGLVAIKRIQNFLDMEEVERKESRAPNPGQTGLSARMKDFSAKWNKEDANCVLSNVNLDIKSKSLYFVVGTVGSGKSSLYQALLGELTPFEGVVSLHGRVSYASQDPWIFPGTVRENILFGERYDLQRYHRVTAACGLEHDMATWDHGDLTLVGERGIKVSGGQKARINLARAVYREADLYLLDDPLSAVDADIGKKIFSECVRGLLRNKAVVLATHQLQYLEDCDATIHVMKKGTVSTVSSYNELVEKHSDVLALEEEYEKSHNQRSQKQKVNEEETSGVPQEKNARSAANSKSETTKVEYKPKHSMKDIVWTYAAACKNRCLHFAFLILVVSFPLSIVVWDAVFLHWMNLVPAEQEGEVAASAFNFEWLKYSGYATLHKFIFLTLTAAAVLLTFRLSAAHTHRDMLGRVLHAPMAFFDVSPTGMIISCFSKDVGILDEMIGFFFLNFLGGMKVLGILILVAYIDFYLLLPFLLVLALLLFEAAFCMRTSKAMTWMEGEKRKSMFQQMNSTMQGTAVIRAYGKTRAMEDSFNYAQDLHSSVFFAWMGCISWFFMWTDFTFSITNYLSCWYFIHFQTDFYDQSGSVGTVLEWSSIMMNTINVSINMYSQLEMCMSAMERLRVYEELEPEGGLASPDDKREKYLSMSEDWPEQGRVEFRNVWMRYHGDGKDVLKGINFKAVQGEKIGIAGRTGAGKSTLLSILFRLSEFDGQVLLDGVDASDVDVRRLRGSISILPQDPLIFDGTVRSNVDPFDQHDDKDIWRALEKVLLKEEISAMPGGLTTKLNAGGTNMSVGQRQLICLARVILRKKKILVLDEATANVDLKTDQKIQRIIRTHFKECTVLTIAHRLQTIMDSDRIMIIADGKVKEFGLPQNLLEDPNSALSQLVDSMEPRQQSEIRNMARRSSNF